MYKRSSRRELFRLIFGQRHTFRLAGPEGTTDRLILYDRRIPKPTGWVVVHARLAVPDVKLMLEVISPNGSVHGIRLTQGEGAAGADLIRLPDAVRDVVLLRDADPPVGATCAGSRALRASDEVVLREISAAEAMLRAATADGWRLGGARLRQIMASAFRRGGVRAALADLAVSYMPVGVPSYQEWVELYARPDSDQAAGLRARAAMWPLQPAFSVVVAAHNLSDHWLTDTITSVRSQIYENWELYVAHDGSQPSHLRALLQREAATDPRMRVRLSDADGSVSASTNSALAVASGAYIALLDQGDMLAPHALLMMAEAINAHPDADLLYSDEDRIDAELRHDSPYFKPDFNLELLHTQNFVSHLGLYRTQLIRELGGLREVFDDNADYDMALRVAATTCHPIIHVPHVLYHRRRDSGGRTFPVAQAGHADEMVHKAIRQQAASLGEAVTVAAGLGCFRRVVYPPPLRWPPVTAIVPTRDHIDVLRVCIDGLLHGTDYPALDVVIVDNGSKEPDTLRYFDAVSRSGVKVLAYPGPFNYAAMNNAAARCAHGEILLLMNNDVSINDAGWLREMVTLMLRPNVGAVGARLLFPDGTLQHGGVVLGMGGVAGHIHRGASGGDGGYFGQLHVVHEVSCCTAACLTIWANTFAKVGGLDADNLPVAFNDVDLCMRLRAAGKRILWTPHAALTHWESKSRGSDQRPDRVESFNAEIAYMKARWGRELLSDPFFNLNLSLDHENPTICFPPRAPRPWDRSPADLSVTNL